MRPNFFTTALAVFLTITLVAPSAFFFAPQKTYAQLGGPSFETNPALVVNAPKTAIESTISAIKNTLTAVHSATTAAATYAGYANTYVLQPLAFALSGRLMKSLTASVIKFTIGETNKSGVPQFVTDTKAMMQSVGDSQALAYIKQFNINSNSPFASAISSSLRSNYLENTTLAGAWAANMDTLERASNDKYRFLNGDWSQGGAGAWMALTTQSQNNPYSLYITMQSKLGSLVINAQTARTNEIIQGQGFLSWCGGGDTGLGAYTTTLTPLRVAQLNVDQTKISYDSALKFFNEDTSGNTELKSVLDKAKKAYDAAQATFDKLSKGTALDSSKYALWHVCSADSECATNKCDGGKGICVVDSATPVGINPGDPCINEDGTSGTTKTPGSVIAASLNKVLGGTQDTLTQMGSIAKEVNGIFKNIGTVMQTASFASDILGGKYNEGGLYGVNSKSGMNSNSAFANYNDSAYFGVTDTMVRAGNATTFSATNDDMPARIAKYQSAWDTIKIAADKAKASVLELKEYCTTEGENVMPSNKGIVPIKLVAQAKAAQDALDKEILPVLAQVAKAKANVATATSTIDAMNAVMKKIKEESPEVLFPLYGPSEKVQSTYDKNVVIYSEYESSLTTMSPTFDDVSNAQQDAKSLASAVAEPDGSLTVSADSLLDKMNLITKNAKSLKSSCDSRFAFTTPPDILEARSRIAQYKLAWDIISAAASGAEKAVVGLENYCIIQRGLAQKETETIAGGISYNALFKFISTSDVRANDARTVFKNIIAPAIIEVATASTNVINATTRVDKIEFTELPAADKAGDIITHNALLLELQTMQPNDEDVVNAQRNAQDTDANGGSSGVTADPQDNPDKAKFSLVGISGGSLFDRLAAIKYKTRSGGNKNYIDAGAGADDRSLSDGVWPWESCDLERNLRPQSPMDNVGN